MSASCFLGVTPTWVINASDLYVTRGIGTAWTPIRLNASPDVVLLTLN